MDTDDIIRTAIPHADFGDPECCGCLRGIVRGEVALIECNECGEILRSVPSADLTKTFHEMEASIDVATEVCVHCGAVNVAPGISKFLAFICSSCGEANELPEDDEA